MSLGHSIVPSSSQPVAPSWDLSASLPLPHRALAPASYRIMQTIGMYVKTRKVVNTLVMYPSENRSPDLCRGIRSERIMAQAARSTRPARRRPCLSDLNLRNRGTVPTATSALEIITVKMRPPPNDAAQKPTAPTRTAARARQSACMLGAEHASPTHAP